MDKSEVEAKLVELVAKQICVSKEKVVRSATFVDLGADSLDVAELIMEIEDAFDVSIPEEAMGSIKTVGDVIDYLAGKA